MDKQLLLAVIFGLTITVAAPAQTIFPGETGSQLLSSIRGSYTPSSVLNINDSRDTLFGVLSLEAGDIVTGVYTGMQITLDTSADPNQDALAKGLNTEHTLPQSVGATEGTQAHADLHNLYPTRSEANTARLNYPLAEIDDSDTDVWYCGTDEFTTTPAAGIIDTCSELDSDADLFEPREDQKGNAARSIFYMFAIYQDQMDREYFAQQRSTLQAWHDNDPVDAAEEARSDKIATYQDGKVNPFIEDATLVDRAFFESNTANATITEIRVDQSGADDDEYFELFGDANGDLTDLTYIVIGDGVGGSGIIEHATDLTGLNFASSGYFVGAEESFTLTTADLTTELGFENTDNVTHMLVEGFTGYMDMDIDSNDDGSNELAPWSSITKCVALVDDAVGGDQTYCGILVGPHASDPTGHVYKADDTSWQLGTYAPVGTDDTPGAANIGLPVELVSFEGITDGDDIVLTWTTLSERNNAGFALEYRSAREAWVTAMFVEGQGSSTSVTTYKRRIADQAPGRHSFRLKQIDFDGSFEYSETVEIDIDIGSVFVLTEAYPNPFAITSSFALSVESAQHIEIDLYNMLGQHVAPLYSGTLGNQETRRIEIDGSALTSGIYIYRVVGDSFGISRQITLIK